MGKLLLVIVPLVLLSGCSTERTEVRNEHDNVVCVYKVQKDFFGGTKSEKRIVCGPGGN